jgi:hypothetical protein
LEAGRWEAGGRIEDSCIVNLRSDSASVTLMFGHWLHWAVSVRFGQHGGADARPRGAVPRNAQIRVEAGGNSVSASLPTTSEHDEATVFSAAPPETTERIWQAFREGSGLVILTGDGGYLRRIRMPPATAVLRNASTCRAWWAVSGALNRRDELRFRWRAEHTDAACAMVAEDAAAGVTVTIQVMNDRIAFRLAHSTLASPELSPDARLPIAIGRSFGTTHAATGQIRGGALLAAFPRTPGFENEILGLLHGGSVTVSPQRVAPLASFFLPPATTLLRNMEVCLSRFEEVPSDPQPPPDARRRT